MGRPEDGDAGGSVFFLMHGSIFQVADRYCFGEDFEAGPKRVATKMKKEAWLLREGLMKRTGRVLGHHSEMVGVYSPSAQSQGSGRSFP